MAVDSLAVGVPAWRRLMPVLFIGVFMSALDTAVIGPAIPALRVAFGVDNSEPEGHLVGERRVSRSGRC